MFEMESLTRKDRHFQSLTSDRCLTRMQIVWATSNTKKKEKKKVEDEEEGRGDH